MTLLGSNERRQNHALHVAVTPEQLAALRAMSARTHRPMSAHVREALDAWIETQKGNDQ